MIDSCQFEPRATKLLFIADREHTNFLFGLKWIVTDNVDYFNISKVYSIKLYEKTEQDNEI